VIPLLQTRQLNLNLIGSEGSTDLFQSENAYLLELQNKRKVAASAMADFSHPA
jgi:hypothetical protein